MIEKGSSADDPKDLSIIGNMLPRYRFGLNLNMDWKNFDFGVFLQGVGKRDFYPKDYIYWGFYQQPYAGGYSHLQDFYRGSDDPSDLMAQHSQAYIEAGYASANTDAKFPVAALDPAQADRYPNVPSAVLLEIRRERRVELAMEGRRLDDLNRWYAGNLMEKEPVGMYFPELGKYDLTGDGIVDIALLDLTDPIPVPREVNELGVTLVYYRAGSVGSNADVYLTNGTSGNVVGTPERGTFEDPKHYYRPIPAPEMALNPNLEQVFGWE